MQIPISGWEYLHIDQFHIILIWNVILYLISHWQGSHKNLRKKFHDFSMTSPDQNPNFQTKKYQYLFLRPMHQFVESRQTQMHTRTQTQIIWSRPSDYSTDFTSNWTDPTILVNLIKMGNRFSKFLLTFEKWYRFLISIQTLYLILSLSYFTVRENILMQLTRPANSSKNASDHCCDQFFLCVLITQVQND